MSAKLTPKESELWKTNPDQAVKEVGFPMVEPAKGEWRVLDSEAFLDSVRNLLAVRIDCGNDIVNVTYAKTKYKAQQIAAQIVEDRKQNPILKEQNQIYHNGLNKAAGEITTLRQERDRLKEELANFNAEIYERAKECTHLKAELAKIDPNHPALK